MAKFRSIQSFQKFTSIHSSVHNHFNQERHLYNREYFKVKSSAALADGAVPQTSAEDNRLTLALMLAAYESHEKGTPITLR